MGNRAKGTGPLAGVRVIDLTSMVMGPYCTQIMADMGADVVRVDRIGGSRDTAEQSPLLRNRRSIALDLKQAGGRDIVLAMAEKADVLIEAFRPGVAERLGIGPDECLGRNARLVYARMTGWGQDGPMAPRAGHDIDYIAIGGALWSLGRADSAPVPPLNLVGDFGGGGMLLAFGMVAALLEAARSGEGQVVDAAMVDGAASLMTMIHAFHLGGMWNEQRGVNMLDTGAPFYEVYETSDGKWMAAGGIEKHRGIKSGHARNRGRAQNLKR